MAHRITLTFPKEPADETPAKAFCPMCCNQLPHHPDKYADISIQLPCGCVLHFSCIDAWFGYQTTFEIQVEGAPFQLTCWNCEAVVPMEPLDYIPGINELYLESMWNPHQEVMIILIGVIAPLPATIEFVDPKDTTFFNPHAM